MTSLGLFFNSRKGYYYISFLDAENKRRQVSTHSTTKIEAIQFLRSYQEKQIKAKYIPLPDFFEEFLQYSAGVHTAHTQRHFQVAFDQFKKHVENIPITAITNRHVETFLAKKTVEASAWTARKYFIALSSAFQKAVDWKYLQTNVFRQVKKPKPPESKPIFFSISEFAKIMKALKKKREANVVAVSFYAGLRLGECLALEWTDVDFATKLLAVENKSHHTTKSKRRRVVPIPVVLVDILRRLYKKRDHDCPLIFNCNGSKLSDERVSRVVKKAVSAAKLNPELHFHSLRHGYATTLLTYGVPIYSVSKLLGHSSVKTTEIYSHVVGTDLKNAVAVFDNPNS